MSSTCGYRHPNVRIYRVKVYRFSVFCKEFVKSLDTTI